jgi:flagellar biosynthesis regulator FlbT
MKINDNILEGHYYKAMKESRELLKHEEELIANVKKTKPAAKTK